jgi:hypothetical protein
MNLLYIIKMNKNIDYVWLASFDIGKKNFCFYIEEVDKKKLLDIDNVDKDQRYNKDGTQSKTFEKILNKVFVNGKKILIKNSDLTENCDNNKYIDLEIFHNMTDLLDDYSEYWKRCDAFVIERQMGFGKNKTNTLALKLAQHCWSYFSFKFGRFKEIVEFPAHYKTQVLGSKKVKTTNKKGKVKYKNVKKKKRKEWCVDKSIKILIQRNDAEFISFIDKSKKKDDIGDVICQLQAFKYLVYVDKSL